MSTWRCHVNHRVTSLWSNMHGGGPDELFNGKENVIEGIFQKLEEVNTGVTAKAG